MAPSSLLSLLAITTLTLAQQDPPISSSNTFVLYPYITSGNLSGPYTNEDISRPQPLTPFGGQGNGSWTNDCTNRILLTNYVPTHCSGQEQCGFQRWSLNGTDPNEKTLGWSTIIVAAMRIADADALGRRQVGCTSDDCGDVTETAGFSVQSSAEGGILHVVYEDQEEEFGTFFACWVEGDIYGPRMFYRNSEGTTPEGCAEVLLVPRCANETSLVQSPVASRCYQGGIPA